jgi:hypothetical protein
MYPGHSMVEHLGGCGQKPTLQMRQEAREIEWIGLLSLRRTLLQKEALIHIRRREWRQISDGQKQLPQLDESE